MLRVKGLSGCDASRCQPGLVSNLKKALSYNVQSPSRVPCCELALGGYCASGKIFLMPLEFLP